nr:receptor-like protein EIX1 [Quercus suber]
MPTKGYQLLWMKFSKALIKGGFESINTSFGIALNHYILKPTVNSNTSRQINGFSFCLDREVKEKLSAEEYRKFVEFMKALKSKEMKISQVLQSIVRLFSGPQRLHLLESISALTLAIIIVNRFKDYLPAKYHSLYEQHLGKVKCIKSEREALVSFKEGVIDIPGKLSSWVGEDCCQWKGVECDDSGHVTKLNLSNPAGRHRHFDYYERYQYYPTKAVVAISKNRNRPCAPTAVCSDICSTGVPYSRGRGWDVNSSFSRDVNASLSGEITRYLRNLSSLTHLDLEGNYNLSTKNFDWVSSLSSLQYLYMGGVKINPTKADWLQAINMLPSLLELIEFIFINQVGKILASFGRLERLKYLYLGANHFSGSIPASIGNLSSLKELDLSYNKMNGTIPESFGQLSKLVKLYLLENSWECVITEAQLMNLTRLEEFVLTTNNKSQPLVFNVKDNWRPPFKLKILHLESCLIGPKFTKWLQVQSELTYVILKNVEIKGTIPEEWFSMISSNLAHLDLSNNQIKGNLPHQLVFPNVTKLFLQSNLFSGTILSNISDLMPSLQYLDLSENHLCGKIPLSISKIKHLNILVLRRNNLLGELPHHWNESQMGLRVVDISHNNICGKILSSMGFLGNLSILVLSNNNLSGEIPSSLKNCSIVSMDFGGNHLSGNLPSWIESDIFMLRLRSNLFSGIISKKWCNLYKLHILDLAQNNLSGGIPDCFNNFIAMVDHNTSGYEPIENYTKKANIVTKGREYEYDRTLQQEKSLLVRAIFPRKNSNIVAKGY